MTSTREGQDHKSKLEQIVGEAFVKATHIVLGARVNGAGRKPSSSASKQWFNMDVDEVEAVRPALEQWRRDISKPLSVQIFLQHTTPPATSSSPSATRTTKKQDVLLEQWVFEYKPNSRGASPDGSDISSSTAAGTSQLLTRIRLEPPAVYKRLVVLMRSLFSLTRSLPAHRLHRIAQRDASTMHLRYVVLAGQPTPPSHTSRMLDMTLRAVETPYGSFGCSVVYQPHSVVTVLELNAIPGAGRSVSHAAESASDTSSRPESSMSASSRMHTAGSLPDPSSSPTLAYGLLRGVQNAGRALTRHASWAFGASPGTTPRGGPLRTVSSPAGDAVHGDGIPLAPLGASAAHRSGVAGAHRTPRMSTDPTRRRLEHQRSWGSGGWGGQPGSVGTPPKHPGMVGGGSPPSRRREGGLMTAVTTVAAATAGGEEDCSKQHHHHQQQHGGDAARGATAPRQSSAPVCIPQRGRGGNRHVASTNDLWAMGGGAQGASPSPPRTSHHRVLRERGGGAGPASAPARGGGVGVVGVGGNAGDAVVGAPVGRAGDGVKQQPAALGDGESVWTSYTSSAGFALSCSPQLPFACTPSAHSMASFSESVGPTAWPMPQPSPPVASCRDPGSLRKGVRLHGAASLQQQQAWGGRWGSSGGESPLLGGVVVPGSSSGTPRTHREHGSLGSSILSGSTPRGALFSGIGTPATALLDPLGPPMTGIVAAGGGGTARNAEMESESECLPFALDGDYVPPSLPPPELMGSMALDGGADEEADAAVCAYLRLVQEAPRLGEAAVAAGGDPVQQEHDERNNQDGALHVTSVLRRPSLMQAMERVSMVRAKLAS